MRNKKTILALLFILLQLSNLHAEDLGFDEICQIYTEAKNSSMKSEQLNDYINNNIAKRISDKDAITTHSIIYQVAPPERYKIFKESAEYSLKREWSCASMKSLMK